MFQQFRALSVCGRPRCTLSQIAQGGAIRPGVQSETPREDA